MTILTREDWHGKIGGRSAKKQRTWKDCNQLHTCQLSRIQHRSPSLPYRSPNLPYKIKLWAFLCFNLEFIPFCPKIWISMIHRSVSGVFLQVYHHWQRLCHHHNHKSKLWWSVLHVRIYIIYNLLIYKCPKPFSCGGGGGGDGGVVVIRGG